MIDDIRQHNIEFFYYENVLFVRDSIFGTAMRNFIKISKELPEKRFVLISLDKNQSGYSEKYYMVDMTATKPEHLITTRKDWDYLMDLEEAVDLFHDFFKAVDRKNGRK